jgi:GTP cyclohydrolase I
VRHPYQIAQELFQSIFGKEFGTSEHDRKTAERFVRAMYSLTTPKAEDIAKFTVFDNPGNDEMIVQTNIPFVSLCAHHLLPFQGVCHIAYIPGSKICGLSKLARTVRHFSTGRNVQEDLTQKIARFLWMKLVDPIGVAVVMSAEHQCMTIRGVQAQGTKTKTSAMLGAFADHDKQARSEFLALIRSI